MCNHGYIYIYIYIYMSALYRWHDYICVLVCYWLSTVCGLFGWLSLAMCYAYLTCAYGYSLCTDVCFNVQNVYIAAGGFWKISGCWNLSRCVWMDCICADIVRKMSEQWISEHSPEGIGYTKSVWVSAQCPEGAWKAFKCFDYKL